MATRRRNPPQIVEFNKAFRQAERQAAQQRFPTLSPDYALRRYRAENKNQTIDEARGHGLQAVRKRYKKNVPLFYKKIVANKSDNTFFRFEHRFRVAAAGVAANMEICLNSPSRAQRRYYRLLAIAYTVDLDLPDDIVIDDAWFYYHDE